MVLARSQASTLQSLAYAQLNAPTPGVVSRKTHGAAGAFDLSLPLTGQPAVECRRPDSNGGYQIVFTFGQTLTTAGTASASQGTATAATVLGPEPNQVTVNLTGVPNAQHLVVSLNNVDDGSIATPLAAVSAPLDVLMGDTGGNGTVNAADIAQTKSLSGQTTTAANFRADLNTDGIINSADIALVKSTSGSGLPPTP